MSYDYGTMLQEEKRENVFLGIIGALVGALLGAAIWVGLYWLGVIASFAGIAIVYFACQGYALLSKSKGMRGVIISIVISVLVLVAAHFLCWGLLILEAFGEELGLTLLDAIRAVPSVAFTEDFIIDFVKELLIGFVLIGVGVVPCIRRARRKDLVQSDNVSGMSE